MMWDRSVYCLKKIYNKNVKEKITKDLLKKPIYAFDMINKNIYIYIYVFYF